MKKLAFFPQEKELITMSKWLSENIDKYFDRLSNPSLGMKVLCHGDFTQGNVMVEQNLQEGSQRRTAFIDWESYFVGNGFVDLTFIILYGTDIQEFKKNPSLFNDSFEFYYERLVRHGFERRNISSLNEKDFKNALM